MVGNPAVRWSPAWELTRDHALAAGWIPSGVGEGGLAKNLRLSLIPHVDY